MVLTTSKRSIATTTVVAALAIALTAQTARADVFGADLPLLTTLLTNSFREIAELQSALQTAQRTYEETRRVAGYAQEAYEAFQAFRNLNGEQILGSFQAAMDQAFPEIGYFRQQASGTGPWAHSTGELQRMVTMCLSGPGGSCVQAQEALRTEDVRDSLALTFGTPLSLDTNAADFEAAQGIASAHAQEQRNVAVRGISQDLLRACVDGASASAVACQAAANTASVHELVKLSEISDQISEQTRLQAVQVALKSAERKREIEEADARRRIIEGHGLVLPPVPMVRVTIPGEERQ